MSYDHYRSQICKEVRQRKCTITQSISHLKERILQLEKEDDSSDNDFTQVFKSVKELEDELRLCRLEGDEFVVYLRGHGHIRLLEITTRGQLIFYRIEQKTTKDLNDPEFLRRYAVDSASDVSDRRIWEERKQDISFCIHEIERVIPKRPSNFQANEKTEAKFFEYDTETQPFRITTRPHIRKADVEIQPVSDSEEIMQMVGAHMHHFNRQQIRVVARLKEMFRLKQTAYNSENVEHEDMLMLLWTTAFPDTPLTSRISTDWEKLGFQGKDPATDFRSMGLFGLHQLIYFAKHYPDEIERISSESEFKEYPWAAVGINVSSILLKLLQLDHNVVRQPANDSAWNTPLFVFLCYVNDPHDALDQCFCLFMMLIDKLFIKLNATYMQFPTVLKNCQLIFEQAINELPFTMNEFRAKLELQSGVHVPFKYSATTVASTSSDR